MTVVLELGPNGGWRQLVHCPHAGAPVRFVAQSVRHLVAFSVDMSHLDILEAAKEPDDLVVHVPRNARVRRLAAKQLHQGQVVALNDESIASTSEGEVESTYASTL